MANIKSLSAYKILKMPFITKGIFFVILSVLSSSCYSQPDFFSSISDAIRSDPKLDFKIDSRNSFVGSRYARIVGVKVGANYDDVFKVGIGYNMLLSEVKTIRMITNSRGQSEVVSARFRMRYVSPYVEYNFYNENPFQLSILVLTGIGSSNFNYEDIYGVEYTTSKKINFIYEPYMLGEFKPFKSVGFGAGVGYRLIASGDKYTQRKVNSPIYVFNLKIYFDEIWDDVTIEK
jgi:hypothetical protein